MRKVFYKIVIVFLLLVGLQSLLAQQDAQYTQYMYNTLSINPAYAGSRDVLSIVGLHRSQWLGIDGAPRTNTLSLHTPIGYMRKVGLGFSVINDEIGPVDETYISGDFSYTIETKYNSKLSFGLKATAQLFSVDFNLLNIYDYDDPEYLTQIDNSFKPNVGLGIFYYGDNYYFGFSAPNLLETEHFDVSYNDSAAYISSQDRVNYYVIGGYVFTLNDSVKFKPAVLAKIVDGAPLQLDVSANFLINEKITIGAAYRWSAALSFLAGFQVSDSMMIGLGYDRETTELQEYTSGSYEIMIRYELFRKYSRMFTPRFF